MRISIGVRVTVFGAAGLALAFALGLAFDFALAFDFTFDRLFAGTFDRFLLLISDCLFEVGSRLLEPASRWMPARRRVQTSRPPVIRQTPATEPG